MEQLLFKKNCFVKHARIKKPEKLYYTCSGIYKSIAALASEWNLSRLWLGIRFMIVA